MAALIAFRTKRWMKIACKAGSTDVIAWLATDDAPILFGSLPTQKNVTTTARYGDLACYQKTLELTDSGQDEPCEKDVYAGQRMDLEQAIARLPERARTVLVLFDIEGYSHAEISNIAGMAVGSSKAQLHRARKLVRKELDK